LALGPATDDELLSLKPDGVEVGEFKTAIEKVASLRGDKLELERKFWRDLDPYNYDYSTEEDRQTAINNAISVFDRLRLNPTEPEWQKLLPYAERNRGKCLSKLQVQIAKNGNLAPKEKPRAPQTSTPSSENADEDLFGEDNTKAAKMVTTRAKAKPKAAAKPKTAQKATARKAAQAKYAPSVKSSEYVHESDDSEEEPVATQPLNKAVPVTKQTVNTKDVKAPTNVVKKDVDTNRSRPTVATTVSPVKKSPASNSGASKSSGAHRNSISSSSSVDLRSQRPRTDGNRVSKDRPTQKSSPLASSPPTNASDIDERAITPTSSTDGSVRSLKRKIIDNVESQQNKRLKPTVEVTHSLYNKDEFQGTPEPWVIAKAARWKEQHEEFVRLRAALEADPSLQDPERVNKVWRMHDELVLVKQELIDAARDPKN
jgi:RNA polymerase II elongation factor ELL